MLLAIDTCGATGGVALGPQRASDPGELSGDGWFHEIAGRHYSELLLQSVSSLLEQAEVQLAELDAIVVVRGPGSFTGIRIGVSAAKGLAEALGIPVIALSRLQLLLRGREGRETAILDAGREEYYARLYDPGDVAEEVLLNRDQLLAITDETRSPLIVCEERLAAALPGALLVEPPTAVDALHAGMELFRRGIFADVETLEALYIRRTGEEMLARIAKHAELRAATRQTGRQRE